MTDIPNGHFGIMLAPAGNVRRMISNGLATFVATSSSFIFDNVLSLKYSIFKNGCTFSVCLKHYRSNAQKNVRKSYSRYVGSGHKKSPEKRATFFSCSNKYFKHCKDRG
jgi:hypothetical protein